MPYKVQFNQTYESWIITHFSNQNNALKTDDFKNNSSRVSSKITFNFSENDIIILTENDKISSQTTKDLVNIFTINFATEKKKFEQKESLTKILLIIIIILLAIFIIICCMGSLIVLSYWFVYF